MKINFTVSFACIVLNYSYLELEDDSILRNLFIFLFAYIVGICFFSYFKWLWLLILSIVYYTPLNRLSCCLCFVYRETVDHICTFMFRNELCVIDPD